MKVIVVGAGPVGCTMALMLAKKGHDVKLVEKYGEVRSCKSRSINITVATRGIVALETVIPDIYQTFLIGGVKCDGRIVHDKHGKQSAPTYYGKDGESIISFNRNKLNDFLVREAKSHKGIEVIFHHELTDCDPFTGQVTFLSKETGETVTMTADLVIGADGAHSAVRYNVQKRNQMKDFHLKQHEHSYIEFYIPPNDQLDPSKLHMWPRGEFMMLALPNNDGSFCGNLFMPSADFTRYLCDGATLLDFCRENFPDLLDIIGEKQLVEDMQPCVNFSPFSLISIKCEPYHAGNKVLIMGDAAHAVVPFYGQGMNAGLQDCLVLMSILDKYQHDKDKLGPVLEEFSQTQCKNGHAIADMAYDHYVKLRSGIAGKQFYIRHFVDHCLNSLSPHSWPLQYDMVAFSLRPYSECQAEKHRQERFIGNVIRIGALVSLCGAVSSLCWAMCRLMDQ